MENMMKNHAAQQTRCSFTRKINFSFKHFEWFHGIKPISDLSSILVDSILRLLQTSLHENRFSAFLEKGKKVNFSWSKIKCVTDDDMPFLAFWSVLVCWFVFRERFQEDWKVLTEKNNTNTNCLTSLIKKFCVSFFRNGKMGQIISIFDRLSKLA